MTIRCSDLKKDPVAAELCREILLTFPISPEELDRGTASIDYKTSGAMPKYEGRDGDLKPIEVYQAYLELATSDPNRCVRCQRLFRNKFGVYPPWIPREQETWRKIKSVFTKIKEGLAKELDVSPDADPDYIIASMILDAIRTPKEEGGLGISYEDHNEAEGNVDKVVQRGFVRCSEFATLFYAIGSLFGLKMYLLEVPQPFEDARSGFGPHAAIMIEGRRTGERIFVDYQRGNMGLSSPYNTYYIGTAADLMGIYLLNASLKRDEEDADGMVLRTERNIPLLSAIYVSPYNDIVLFGLGNYYRIRGKFEEASHYFEETLRINPNHTSALISLCLVSFREDVCKEAFRRLGIEK